MQQRRPALVVAVPVAPAAADLLRVLMVTSGANRGSPDDVAISDLAVVGLPAASIVRTAKIATIEARDAERLGGLSPADRPPGRQDGPRQPLASPHRLTFSTWHREPPP